MILAGPGVEKVDIYDQIARIRAHNPCTDTGQYRAWEHLDSLRGISFGKFMLLHQRFDPNMHAVSSTCVLHSYEAVSAAYIVQSSGFLPNAARSYSPCPAPLCPQWTHLCGPVLQCCVFSVWRVSRDTDPIYGSLKVLMSNYQINPPIHLW